MMAFIKQRPFVSFIIITVLLAVPINLIAGAVPSLNGFSLPGFILKVMSLLGSYAPAFAAAIVILAQDGDDAVIPKIKSWFVWKVSYEWYLVAIVLPILALFVLNMTPSWFNNSIKSPFFMFQGLWNLFMAGLIGGGVLGAEIGFRGYALPYLQKNLKINAWTASIILAGLWLIIALPRPIAGIMSGHEELTLGLIILIVSIIPISILLTWLYNNTKSIVPGIVLHAFFQFTFNFTSIDRIHFEMGQIQNLIFCSGFYIAAAVLVLIYFNPAKLCEEAA